MKTTLTAETTNPEPVADDAVSSPAPPMLTPHVQLKRVVMLVNPMSGSVGSNAMAEAEAILAEYDLDAAVHELSSANFDKQIDEALKSRPDVLITLAGDGTAGTIASRAGADGPMIAPLPGGTMNMLPKALYGTTDWKLALRRALEEGARQSVAGGRIQEHTFYCAAIMGSPALWAPAREAVRSGKLKLAWAYGRRALRRAFSGRIRFSLDGGAERRAEALVLISPMISKAMDENTGLEAAIMNPANTSEVLRMAAHAVMNDWREDPSVTTQPVRRVRMRGRSKIPAVIDGEPVLLHHDAKAEFIARAFHALAPNPPEPENDVQVEKVTG